jgi:hypothetical protein
MDDSCYVFHASCWSHDEYFIIRVFCCMLKSGCMHVRVMMHASCCDFMLHVGVMMHVSYNVFDAYWSLMCALDLWFLLSAYLLSSCCLNPVMNAFYCISYAFFSLYIFRGFCVYGVPMPPLRGQHTVLCHPKWLPTPGLTEFAVCWGGAGFKPRTTGLQSGALPLSHLSSLK